MPIPATQIVNSGTPITNVLGVGAVAGNVVTIGGVALGPNQPGWALISSQGGPGFVNGQWQYGSSNPAVAPAQGAFYRSGSGAGSGGGSGGSENEGLPELPGKGFTAGGYRITKTGWILIGLIATLLLTDKGK